MPDSPPPYPSRTPPVPGARRSGRHRQERARTTPAALLLTLIGTVVPGSGYVFAGRRRLGALVMTLAGLLAGGVVYAGLERREQLIQLAVDPGKLLVLAVALAVLAVAWVLVIVSSHRLLRPAAGGAAARVAGSAVVGLLCFAVAAPLAIGVQTALTQRSLVSSIFGNSRSATRPSVDKNDPWAGRPRLSLLLLGADDGVGRKGVRTDSVIVASIDTWTGQTALISMPRKLMFMPFPVDSPLHERYPDGFGKDGITMKDRLEWMLDAMYDNVPEQNKDLLNGSDNKGADVLKLSVGEATGLRIDYYVQVNLKGFSDLVTALGGITVNINYPIPVGGSDDANVPPKRYLQPGPNQLLMGHDALWYARGRYKVPNPDDARQARQRCAIKAIADKADPATLVRKYQALASASRNLIRTDIPADLLPAFVDLGLKVKSAEVVAVPLDGHALRFAYPHPDYDGLRKVIARALAAAPEPAATPSPSTPTRVPQPSTRPATKHTEDLTDACAYHPDER
ncbi:MAG TPA: LCP family protein [Kribbellaceae bacterium]